MITEKLFAEISYLKETIKAKDAEISILKNSEKLNLHSNYVLICEKQDKTIAEARELTNVALKITEERLFWIKDEFIMESEQVEEWREKAKAWLENNR